MQIPYASTHACCVPVRRAFVQFAQSLQSLRITFLSNVAHRGADREENGDARPRKPSLCNRWIFRMLCVDYSSDYIGLCVSVCGMELISNSLLMNLNSFYV